MLVKMLRMVDVCTAPGRWFNTKNMFLKKNLNASHPSVTVMIITSTQKGERSFFKNIYYY